MKSIALEVSELTLARLAQHQADRIRTAVMNASLRASGIITRNAGIHETRECRAIHRSIRQPEDRRLFRALVSSFLHPEVVK